MFGLFVKISTLTSLLTGRGGATGDSRKQVEEEEEEEEHCPVSGGEEKERSLLVSGRLGSVRYVSRQKVGGGGGEETLWAGGLMQRGATEPESVRDMREHCPLQDAEALQTFHHVLDPEGLNAGRY